MITKQRLCVRVYIVLSSFVCKSDILSRMALNDFSVIIIVHIMIQQYIVRYSKNPLPLSVITAKVMTVLRI